MSEAVSSVEVRHKPVDLDLHTFAIDSSEIDDSTTTCSVLPLKMLKLMSRVVWLFGGYPYFARVVSLSVSGSERFRNLNEDVQWSTTNAGARTVPEHFPSHPTMA